MRDAYLRIMASRRFEEGLERRRGLPFLSRFPPPPPHPPAFVPWFRSEAVHSTRNSRDAEKRRRVGLNAAGSFDGTWNRGFRSLQKRWTSVWVHCARCSRWANSWNALRMYCACYSNGSGISRLSFRWERFAKLATIQRGYCDLM